MRRSTLALAILATLPFEIARAADEGAPPNPAQQALMQMYGECQNREANALVQVYTLRAQLADAMKRADAAEAKLKASAAPDK